MEEQRLFASTVGAQVAATYQRACIFNADEMTVYYDDDPGGIIAERGAPNPPRSAAGGAQREPASC